MRRLTQLTLVLLLFPLVTSTSAQSLGEIAKKERERRAQNQQKGKTAETRYIDDRALVKAEGETATIIEAEVDSASKGSPPKTRTSRAPRRSTTSRATSTKRRDERRRETLAERAANRKRYEDAVASLELLKQSQRDCRIANRRKSQFTTSGCDGIDDRVKAQEKRVRELKRYR